MLKFEYNSEKNVTVNGDVAMAAMESQLSNGASALDLYMWVRGMQECLKRVEDGLKPSVLDVLGGSGKELPFAKVEPMEAGVKYDYAVCGDKVYDALLNSKVAAEKALKAREAFLKAVKDTLTYVDDNGEMITVKAPYRTSTMSVKVSFQK